jgi:hypothetical protein
VIWPDVAWQWVQTVGDLFSLGHYKR